MIRVWAVRSNSGTFYWRNREKAAAHLMDEVDKHGNATAWTKLMSASEFEKIPVTQSTGRT